jgi:5-methylthioadenosine/S-adenosylhomocysteine deaminase
MYDILISGATIVTVGSKGMIERGYLGIEGQRIAVVGEGSPPADCRGARVIEAEGMVVMPGLVNAHTHLAMTLMRGVADDMDVLTWLEKRIWPMEAKLTYEDCYWGGMLGIVEMLRGGTTCFNDMYHFFDATAQAIADSGIRGCPSLVLLGFLPSAEKDLQRALELADQWADGGDGRVVPMLGPHAPYSCDSGYLRDVARAAKQRGMGLHIHLSESRKEVEEFVQTHGKTPIAEAADDGLFDCPTLAAHCVHATSDDIRILADRNVGVSHNPGSNLKLASGFAPVVEMLERGVKVGIGTDGAASNNNLDMFEEMRLAALVHKATSGDPTAVPASKALEMATLGSARALGLEKEIGSLEVGKKADIILLGFRRPHLNPRHDVVSHIVYAARADDVHTVIVDGKVVWDGEFVGLDEEAIIGKASEQAFSLLARAGGNAPARAPQGPGRG